MTSREKMGVNLDAIQVSVYSLVGYVGFLMLVVLALTLFGTIPECISASLSSAWEMRFILAVSGVLSFCFLYLCAFQILSNACKPLFMMGVTGSVGAAILFFTPFPQAVVPCIVACGVGLAALSTLWFCFIYTLDNRGIFSFLSIAVAAAVLLCIVAEYLSDIVVMILVVSFFVLSLACMAFLFRTKPEVYKPPIVMNKDSDKRSKILATSAIMLALTHFEFGFIIGMAADGWVRLLCLGTSLVLCIFMAFDTSKWRFINERRMAPLTTPLTVMAFGAMFLFGEVATWGALCLLSALCTVYSVSGIAALAEHARISRLSLVRVFAKAYMFDFFGLTIGLIAGLLCISLASGDPVDAIRFSIGIAIVYGFMATFCHKARFPENSMVEVAAAEKGAKSIWLRRCKAVGEEFELSERQFEVLALIAQGRNAHYIKNILTISESTAQTHIRNIYHKTGVHSRQELLNLIEGTKLYGEE